MSAEEVFSMWRINGGSIVHARPGRKLTAMQGKAITGLLEKNGLSGMYDPFKQTVIVSFGTLTQLSALWKDHGSYAVKKAKREAKRAEVGVNRDLMHQDYAARLAAERDAKAWIDDTFGADAMNIYNKVALMKFITGKAKKFGGLANHKWRAGLEKLQALDENSLINFALIKRAYQERKA